MTISSQVWLVLNIFKLVAVIFLVTNVKNHSDLKEATSTSNAQVEAIASNVQVAPSGK